MGSCAGSYRTRRSQSTGDAAWFHCLAFPVDSVSVGAGTLSNLPSSDRVCLNHRLTSSLPRTGRLLTRHLCWVPRPELGWRGVSGVVPANSPRPEPLHCSGLRGHPAPTHQKGFHPLLS